MKTDQVNLRLEADLISAIKLAAEEESVDRATMIRKLLHVALDRRRVDRALAQYQSGEISIGRAAEDARLSHWEILDLARVRGIAYRMDLEETAERLELQGPLDQSRVGGAAEAYAVAARDHARGGDMKSLPDFRPRSGGVLLVGLNPAPVSVASGHYYQGPIGRRLWRRLTAAGLLVNATPGAEDDAFVASGHGLTDLVKRPTASARELKRHELKSGVEELRAKVREWQPALILFAFKTAADAALGSKSSPGPEALFEGVPTFLLSGPYAPKDEADRVDSKLRDVLSTVIPDAVPVLSQPVTAKDIESGNIRLPRPAKALLPDEKSTVSIVLRGTAMEASYNPMRYQDKKRSGVLRIGTVPLSRLVKAGERLRISNGPNGRICLD